LSKRTAINQDQDTHTVVMGHLPAKPIIINNNNNNTTIYKAP